MPTYPYHVAIDFDRMNDREFRMAMQAWMEEHVGKHMQDWEFGVEMQDESKLNIYFTDEKKAAIFKVSWA